MVSSRWLWLSFAVTLRSPSIPGPFVMISKHIAEFISVIVPTVVRLIPALSATGLWSSLSLRSVMKRRFLILVRGTSLEGRPTYDQSQLFLIFFVHWVRAFSALISLEKRPCSNKEQGWRQSWVEPTSSTNGKMSFCELREKSLRRAGRLTTEWTKLTPPLWGWLSFWQISWPT